MKTVFKISAGGVVYRRSGDSIEFLLISVKDGSVWTLPKGLVEKGEKPEDAAVREVREETGVNAKIVTFLGKTELWFFLNENDEKVRHHKIVYYYLMEYESGSTEEHDFEVVSANWFTAQEAIGKATYKKDKEILQKALDYLKEKKDV